MKTVTQTEVAKEKETALDLNTIRARVKQIKSTWNQETAKQRAEEGKRRRAELEQLLLGTPAARKSTQCDFTLVV